MYSKRFKEEEIHLVLYVGRFALSPKRKKVGKAIMRCEKLVQLKLCWDKSLKEHEKNRMNHH